MSDAFLALVQRGREGEREGGKRVEGRRVKEKETGGGWSREGGKEVG